MDDLKQRLRGVTEADAYAEPWTFGQTCHEAAAALEAKDAEIARLREALRWIAESTGWQADHARAALTKEKTNG